MIEIRNYNPNIANKSLVASFDLIIRGWGFVIRECKLFEKEDKRWIVLPNKAVKNQDGTWGTPIPYFEFFNKDAWFKLQKAALDEIQKTTKPVSVLPKSQYQEQDLPF